MTPSDKPSVRDLHLQHVRSVTDRMRRLGGDADNWYGYSG